MNFKSIKFILGFTILIWGVYFSNHFLPFDLRSFGIIPRTQFGAIGIIASPLLHGNIGHIISNTAPLIIFSLILFSFYNQIAYKVFFLSYLLSGLFVWIMGREAIHIGASSLIYALASFLIFAGIFRKNIITIILSVTITILYGSSMFLGLLPLKAYVSWEGHLLGAVAGLILSYLFFRR